jgi:hypothetical protein
MRKKVGAVKRAAPEKYNEEEEKEEEQTKLPLKQSNSITVTSKI